MPWALFTLAGCGERAAREGGAQRDLSTLNGRPAGGTLVVLADREPDELNPLTYASHPASQVTHLIYRTLARRDSTLSNYRPDLALWWELTPDSSAVIVRLRDDVFWHDGRPVTAGDVAFTIESQRDERVASPRQADVGAVTGAQAVDSFTVRVELEEAGPYTVNALLHVMPVPRHLLQGVPPERLKFSRLARRPVGNGLFRFVEWRAGQSITLAANTEAPEGRPPLDRIVLRFVPEPSAALTELLSGQADLMMKLPPDFRERVERSERVRLAHTARVRPAWIAWNLDREPVDDRRVRRALLMGIDREALVGGLFGEEGRVAWSPIPPGLAEHSGSVEPVRFDPERARELLDQAGWRDRDGDGVRERAGRPLRLEVDYLSSDAVRRDVLVGMQAMLRRVGVELVPRPYESTAWVDRLYARDFVGSFWGWGWGPGVVGINAEMILHSRSIPPDGPNFIGYSDDRLDGWIDSVLVEFDPARSRELWRMIEQRVIDDAAYAPIYLDPELIGVHRRFRDAGLWGVEWWEDVHTWWVPPGRRLPRD
ncbi:MAG: ABC transporter substrate-binding protein [Longimicrobiaceae bacterium]